MSKTERMKNFEKEIKKVMNKRNYDNRSELQQWNVHYECCDVERKIFNNQ